MTSGFSVQQAIETIDRATAYDAALRRRTEGVTWMVWGLVTAVVVVSGKLAGLSWQGWTVALALWPLAGLMGIAAVWRIGALSAPSLAPDASNIARAAIVAGVSAAGMGMLGWFVYVWTGTYAGLGAVFALLPWGLVNAAQWRRITEAGRRIAVVAGIVMALAGTLIASTWPMEPSPLDMLALAAIAGGGPFAVGLYRALTG